MTIYVPNEIKESVKQAGINASRVCREALLDSLVHKGIEIAEPEPKWVALAFCPSDGNHFATSSLFPTCNKCGKRFRLVPKKVQSRIRSMLKGTPADVIRAQQQGKVMTSAL